MTNYQFLKRWYLKWVSLALSYNIGSPQRSRCVKVMLELDKRLAFFSPRENDYSARYIQYSEKNVLVEIKHARVSIPNELHEITENVFSNFVIGFFRKQYGAYPGVIFRSDGSMWKIEMYWAHCN